MGRTLKDCKLQNRPGRKSLFLRGKIILALSIFLLGAFPPFFNAVLGLNSLAYGLAAYSFLLFIIESRYFTIFCRIHKKYIIFMAVAVIYCLFQMAVVGSWNIKSYTSIPILVFVLMVAYFTAIKIRMLSYEILFRSLGVLVFLLFLVGFINILFDLRFLGYSHERAVVPFLEPSHYALFSGTFFLIYFVLANKISIRIFILIFVLILSVLLLNTTLLVFDFLMIILWVRIRIAHLILLIPIGLYVFYLVTSNSYFSERILIGRDSENLSALVYQQGIDDASKSLVDTGFIGLGFQMMGTQPPSDIAYKIAKYVDGNELNREDGSFLAAKIIAEFGIFGGGIVFWILYRSASSFLCLRRAINSKINEYDSRLLVFQSVLFAFLVELLVRGYGYFSPGMFVYVVSVVYLTKYEQFDSRCTQKIKGYI